MARTIFATIFIVALISVTDNSATCYAARNLLQANNNPLVPGMPSIPGIPTIPAMPTFPGGLPSIPRAGAATPLPSIPAQPTIPSIPGIPRFTMPPMPSSIPSAFPRIPFPFFTPPPSKN